MGTTVSHTLIRPAEKVDYNFAQAEAGLQLLLWLVLLYQLDVVPALIQRRVPAPLLPFPKYPALMHTVPFRPGLHTLSLVLIRLKSILIPTHFTSRLHRVRGQAIWPCKLKTLSLCGSAP